MIEAKQKPLSDFDHLATEYDKWYETSKGRLYDKLEKRALLRLCDRVKKGDTLLEVGMGTGWWSRFFSELGFDVTGVDISPKMLETAQAKRIPKAVFKLADAHNLPFADGCFSVSAAITSIEFTREPETVIREMARCTKPGGRLLLGVLNSVASLNQKRKKRPKGPIASAHFFSVEELYELLAPYGKVTIKSCAFPFSIKMPTPLAHLSDDIMALLKRESGTLIAARIKFNQETK